MKRTTRQILEDALTALLLTGTPQDRSHRWDRMDRDGLTVCSACWTRRARLKGWCAAALPDDVVPFRR